MQRFEAAFPGNMKHENPERLVRNSKGDFVLYAEAVSLIRTAMAYDWGTDESVNEIPYGIVLKMQKYL